MSINQLLAILWARRRILLLTLSTTVLATLVGSMLWPKTYTATAFVVIDYKGTDPLTGVMLPAQLMPSYMATQIDIVSSHNVALKVVDRLRLGESEAIRDKFQAATHGQGNLSDWIADDLLGDLDVKPSRDSGMIAITFGGEDPQQVAAVANAFSDAYIQTSLELKVEPARRQANWFDEQTRDLRNALVQAQSRLSQYQKDRGIVAADSHLDVESDRLAEISSQLVTAQTQLYDSQSRSKQLKEAEAAKHLQDLPDIVQNPLLQSMKADLARAEGKLAEVGGHYSVNHPQYRSAQAEVSALRSRIASEIKIAVGSIRQSADIAEQRVKELQVALEQQKQRILELKEMRSETDALAKDVENAQKAYDVAMQRASQVRLESQMDEANIAILNPAIPPLKPSKPKTFLNLVLSFFIGSILGTGAAFLAELLDRRVRVGEDIAEGAGMPVLVELSDIEDGLVPLGSSKNITFL